jgi:hypothetical protein
VDGAGVGPVGDDVGELEEGSVDGAEVGHRSVGAEVGWPEGIEVGRLGMDVGSVEGTVDGVLDG